MSRISLLIATALVFTLPALAQDAIPGAAATFLDAQGVEVGSVTLAQSGGSVVVTGQLTGIAAGDHGFHFHETGDCDPATEFESAGGHFNPTSQQHGLENPEGPHAGDLPNVVAAADGTLAIELTADMISLQEGNPTYVFDADGSALVIHAGPDDNVTDPAGNSGARLACAVIEAAPPA